MPTPTRPFDPNELLKDAEDYRGFLALAFEHGDAAHIAFALGVVARSHSMRRLAQDTGLARESLYRGLSENGNPELATVLKVLGALGLRLTVVAGPPSSRSAPAARRAAPPQS
jgi:probable addiction module antidote protein